tara:strand:+ start:15363 stop:16853 length:1491 start_codon:yes stop_codon:yes gene_type:complete
MRDLFIREEIYIGGQWCRPSSGGSLPIINPATEEKIGSFAAGNAEDIERAVSAATKAFHGSWGHTSGRERACFLEQIAQVIEREQEHLARLEVLDNGKPLAEALWDIEDTAGCFRYYAGLARELEEGCVSPVELPDPRFQSQAVREPAGVAGLIIPWNYPMLMAAWKVAPALAAGCAMVLKPSELTSMTALELARIAHQVHLPAGVLNVVTGTGLEVGAPLCRHQDVQKVAFTGSVETGRAVMKAAAENITPVSLELGGKSPILVFDDVDLDTAVEWIMFGIFWNKGEVCSATSRLLVQQGIYEPLMKKLVDAAEKLRIGDGLTEGIQLGPLVSQGQYEKVSAYLQRAKAQGLKLLMGGVRPAHLSKGYFLAPTIFDQVPEDSEIWREEIFGPVLAARTFEDELDAIGQANKSRFGLAAAVMTQDEDRLLRMARALRAGIVWLNCSQPTFCEAPWGGRGLSGIGRELGPWGLENYLETKQVTRFRDGEKWGWYGIG